MHNNVNAILQQGSLNWYPSGKCVLLSFEAQWLSPICDTAAGNYMADALDLTKIPAADWVYVN